MSQAKGHRFLVLWGSFSSVFFHILFWKIHWLLQVLTFF